MRRSFGHLPAVLAVLALATACASDATTAQVVATAPATPVANAGSAASTAPSTAPAGRSATTPPTTAGRATTTVGGPTRGGSGGGSRGTVRWHSCPDTKGFQCATLTVPLDRADPSGPTINIALNRRPANDLSKRIGSLVVNPGGPGGSGLELAANLPATLPTALLDRFDLVGFDPRGVGESEGIVCTTDAQKDERVALDDRPDTRAEIDALVQSRLDDGAACQGSDRDLIPYLTTIATARDLDLIRAAIGDEKLTYLGFSYGTHLGATYAQLFPTHVRALVLDGVVNPQTAGGTNGPPELDETYGTSFDRAFDRFTAACIASTTCPLRPDPRAARDAAAAGVETTPLPATDDRRQVGAGMFNQGVASSLYSHQLWPMLATALKDAADGDGTFLLKLADNGWERGQDGHYKNLRDANHAIACADTVVRTDVDAVKVASAALTLPLDVAALDTVLSHADCSGTPVGKEPFTPIGPAVGAPPILLVGTEGDPATDVANTEPMARALGSGVAIFWDGDGHTAFTNGSSCIDDAVVGYLTQLTVPADGMRCAANPPGTPNAPAQGVAYGLDRPFFQRLLQTELADVLGSATAAKCVAAAVITQFDDTEFAHFWYNIDKGGVVAKAKAIVSRC